MDFEEQPNETHRRETEDLKAAFRAVIATASGKTVLFWLFEQAGIYREAFSGEDAATNYRLGEQAMGRKMIEMLNSIDPRAYPRLLLDVADMRAMAQAALMKEDDDDVA